MAGIDINNVFPTSKMAGAARLGQSQFRSVEGVSTTMVRSDLLAEPTADIGTNDAQRVAVGAGTTIPKK